MKPASRKPTVISFQSICQSPRKLWATSDQAAREVRRSRQPSSGSPSGAGDPAAARWACSRASSSTRGGTNAPQQHRHQRDHHDPAEVLAERELPADQDPQHEPELPDEVRGGELERERRGGRGALLEQALGDRDRGVGAGRGGRAEAGGARDGREARRPTARLDPLARDPGLHDRGDREAEHERPPDLPCHQEGVREAVADRRQDSAMDDRLYPHGVCHT